MTNKKYPICVSDEKGGIGNRIKNLFSFIRRNNNPKELILIWPDYGWVSAKFKDLFVFDYPIIIHEYSNIESVDKDYLEPQPTSWRFWIDNEKDKISKNFSKNPLDKDIARIDLEYNRTPKQIKDAYLHFQALKPQKHIQKIIDSVDIPPKTIALQIRNNKDWKLGGRNTDLKKFIKIMKKYPKNTLFFLSAMNKETSNCIKSIFKTQIIEIPNKDYCSMDYAVADLYLLAKCNRGIYSLGSTFAELAWWLGGCIAEVSNVGSYKEWQEIKVKYSIIQEIFSIKNEYRDGIKHKVVTLFGIKFKFKIKNN